MNRTEFITMINNIDWGKSDDNNLPAISFLLRCSEDYGYVESIAQGKITTANDIRMKTAGELIKKGIEFIPVIGDLFSMISNISGIDLTAFKSISDSGTARQRLIEWINFMNQNYTNTKNNLPPLTDMNQRFAKATMLLINARPKCISPTENCNLEHARYIVRTSLLKESQQAIYDIYYTYCQSDFTFNTWLTGLKTSGGTTNNTNTQKSTSSALPLLLIAGLLLSKKGL